ncbi:MAG TPA: protein-tyrosine phosphatase family protein [Geminicoccus sp.]|uniref:tyrosine phosphatase family protein n=1 Tax=Geminicoccus sp. TaxID=2024832 RepID=UPI002C61C9F5|nr:protein-tyrosine phosphatase family protein [Geminicoccus sp.]HWL71748.1 protein-tyrosine phosphatase family protein [Geminicoccus sp.]
MQSISISMLTICGIEELPSHDKRLVTHVLSILDPEAPEIAAFDRYDAHERTTLRFHDIIEPRPGQILPQPEHVQDILRFGAELAESRTGRTEGHLLVHCHMGVSRSTAAMLTLMAQNRPDEDADHLFERLREIRPQAWPNSRMVRFADEALDRRGRLTEALTRHYAHQLRAQPRFQEWMTQLGRQRELEMAAD